MSNLYETDAEFMERFEQFAYNEVVNEKDQQLEEPVRDWRFLQYWLAVRVLMRIKNIL